MTARTANKSKRRTVRVAVTTMEEMPVLTKKERDELLTSLKEAEARIWAGEGIYLDRPTFKQRLLKIHRAARNKKSS
jgi:hypothetical protein